MTIEERLEALAARHEALAQSMELTHLDIQDLGKNVKKHDEQIEKILEASRRDGENIAALARISQAHQGRIGDLGNNQQ